MTDDPCVLLGIAKSCLGLGDYEDASRFSQKAISAGGSSVSTETYLVRAEALQATGCTDLAQKHLTVALQMDPDNSVVQGKLKRMRKTVAETARVRASVDEAMNARNYELAITRCSEGFQIDKEAKKLIAEFHEKRAKVREHYQILEYMWSFFVFVSGMEIQTTQCETYI
jgi:tetratricopeptide (TPR) repeat protein